MGLYYVLYYYLYVLTHNSIILIPLNTPVSMFPQRKKIFLKSIDTKDHTC